MVKNAPANAGDAKDGGSIPGSGRCPGEGNGNPLQSSYTENPTARGSRQATVPGVTKSRTQLSAHTLFRNKSVVPSSRYTFLIPGLPHFKFSLLPTSNFLLLGFILLHDH